jgi:DNA helicase-2/ATP-dependent DNA helicase PcrA
MYVAITRARKRLYLSLAQTRLLHGQTRYNVCSRFVEELPDECLKWITPKQGGFGNAAGLNEDHPKPAWGRSAIYPEMLVASSATPAPKQAPEHGIVAGIGVFHNKFGEGRVLAVEGAGDDARAQVHFPRHGVKWLALAVAKLTVVD